MYMYGFSKGGGKIDSESYGYNMKDSSAVSVTWKDFSEVMVPELSCEFGSEQVDLFLEIGHKEHRCACGKLCGRYGTRMFLPGWYPGVSCGCRCRMLQPMASCVLLV